VFFCDCARPAWPVFKVALLLAASLIAGEIGASEPHKLIVYGDQNLPPYEFLHDGVPQGAMVDLVHAVSQRMGRQPEIILGKWDAAQTAVLAGHGHALSIMAASKERGEKYDFSDETFRMSFSLFALAERRAGLNGSNLAGLRVGVTEGGFPQAFLRENHPELTLVVVDDYIEGFRRVLRREIDAVAANTWPGEYFLSELNISGIGVVSPPLVERPSAMAIPKGNPQLLSAINEALRQVKADGTFDRIIDKWSTQKVYVLTEATVVRAKWLAGGGLAILAVGGALWVFSRQRKALAAEVAGRQRSEAARAESEALFNSLTDTLPGFVFVTGHDGGNTFVNGAFLNYTGLARDDLMAAGWLQIVHPDDLDSAIKIWGHAVTSGTDYEAKYRFRRHDGVYRWFLCRGKAIRDANSGRILQWVGVSIDIENIKQVQAALAHERDRARSYLQVAGVMLIVIDTEGRIETINRRGAEILGYTDEAELIGRDWFEFALPAGTQGQVRQYFDELGCGESDVSLTYENPVLRADGSQRLIAWRNTVLRDEEGRITGTLGSGEDITDARQAELVLARDRAELEWLVQERTVQLVQLQKMEALGQLTGGVAHDFNNVLQGLASALSVLENHVPVGDPRDMLEAAQRSIQSGARLTQALLAFARRQTLAPESVDLRKLLESLRPLLERTLGGMIRIKFAIRPGVPLALVDSAQLESAILNLAINARDAMPSGGSLTLRAAAVIVRPGESGHPPELKPGKYVTVGVEDTGAGIEETLLARVFEPFFTTKEFGKGSGLGLSMVHGMAVQSGGGVSIVSRTGQGTVVTLYLPRAVPGEREIPPSPAIVARGDDHTVLLVDDNDLMRNALKITLEGLGYLVLVASSGNAALALVQENRNIDALVTDYAMPGMNGAELTQEARRLVADLPVLLITGYAEGLAEMQDLTVLHKPFKLEDLISSLAGLLRGKAPRTGKAGSASRQVDLTTADAP
jgi:PAS domain S-box-containing protein